VVVASKRQRRRIALPQWLILLGWLAAALMAIAVALLIWSSL
jgi:hypothetical protein